MIIEIIGGGKGGARGLKPPQEKLLINNMQEFTTNMTIHILYEIVGQLNTL